MSRRPSPAFEPWAVAAVLVMLFGIAGVISWAVSKSGELPPAHRSAR